TGGGQTTQITVTFTVGTGGGGSGSTYTLSTNFVSLAYPSGLQSQTVSISSATQSTYNFFTQSVNNWLLVNGTTLGSAATISGVQISFSTTQLAHLSNGQYTGTVTITNPSPGVQDQTITVNLTVGTGGGGSYSVTPSSLSFTAPQGGAAPANQS